MFPLPKRCITNIQRINNVVFKKKKCLKRTTMDDDGRKPNANKHLSDSSELKTLHVKPHTLVVRPVVDADVTYPICTPQVYSPFCCIITLSIDRALTFSYVVVIV